MKQNNIKTLVLISLVLALSTTTILALEKDSKAIRPVTPSLVFDLWATNLQNIPQLTGDLQIKKEMEREVLIKSSTAKTPIDVLTRIKDFCAVLDKIRRKNGLSQTYLRPISEQTENSRKRVYLNSAYITDSLNELIAHLNPDLEKNASRTRLSYFSDHSPTKAYELIDLAVRRIEMVM